MHLVAEARPFRMSLILLLLMLAFLAQGVVAQNSDASRDPALAIVEAEIPPKDPADVPVEPASPAGISAISLTTYPFTATTGVALEDMTSGTTQLVAANAEDTASAVTNIGFDFWYDGVRASQFSVNANGLMRLGSIVVSTSSDNSTGFASTTNAPKIAPYYDNLRVGSDGKVHYKVVGVAPNRKLVVEWFNMQIPRQGAQGPGAGVFQAWLFESTGVIQFVYGTGILVNSASAGYTVGLQSGVATNFASVTTATATVSYSSANNTQSDAIASGTSYVFTPNVPADPTNLTFTGTTAVGTTLNWNDNSSNEVGFLVFRSTDGGATYSFLAQAAANATSFSDSNLTPTTTYFYRVYAVSEGALSANAAAGSVTTNAPGNVTSTAGGGLWSSPATWVGGLIPTSSDNVTIAGGATVDIDIAAFAWTVTVSGAGLLEFEPGTARTLTVGGDVTINNAGIFQSASSGTVTTHNLSVAGNLVNNGTLDFSTNGDTAGATITFTGASNTAFTAAGPITDIRAITMNKGTSPASILELSAATDFTVRGVNTDVAGFLTLTNGTFKISGNFTMTNRVFTTAAYTIAATAGIWLNNPNFTVAGTISGSSTSNNGLLRLTQGTYNVGLGAGDQMRGGAGASFLIEGGTLNVAGAFDPQLAVSYAQSGGTLNLGIVGNTVSNFGTFELFSTTSTFTMSGGVINLINPNTGSIKVDFRVLSTTFSITGGKVVIGAAPAPAGSVYNVPSGIVPSFDVNAGMTVNLSSSIVVMRGTSVANEGAIISTGASARFDFGGSAPMIYSGAGTFGTAVTPFSSGGVSSNSLSLITLNAPIITTRVNLFQGGFVNSNQITLGNGGASATTVQIGSTGLTTPGGSFDVSPIHNQGSGGETVRYEFETAPRTTGVEINSTRNLSFMFVDNPNNVTISGGDLTVMNTAAALTLTNGRVITGANTLALSSGTATVTRTNGWVDGRFRKNFSAAANKTFEVGTANGYSPVGFNATSGSFPVDVTVVPAQTTAPGLSSALSLARYWTLTVPGAPGTVTADLTFNYLATDVPGTVIEANLSIVRGESAVYSPVAGTINATLHQAFAPGVSTFSDWTLTIIPATATVSGDATICAGASTTISASLTGLAPWNLVWSDGFVQNGVITSPATRVVSPASTTTYTVVTVTDANGAGTSSGSATVTVNPIPPTPTITPGGPTTFCQGGSVTLTSSSATGNQWYVDGNPIGGATGSTYNATTSGSYTVIVTQSGCSSAASAAVVVTVNPIPPQPTITPGGPTTFCQGGSVTLTSSAASGNQWYLNGNPIGGATNQTYNATASGNYTVIVTASGCSSPASAATSVTVNPTPPTPTITPGGPTAFCQGGSVTLTSSSATGNQWYRDATPIVGATNQTYNATSTGAYTVVVTALGCPSAPSSATNVTVNPNPAAPAITAPRSVVVGATSQTASVPNTAGSSYAWTLTGGTITGGQGTATLQYDAGPAGTRMSFSVVETNANGCVSPAGSKRVMVDFLDVPPSHPFHNFIVTLALNGITGGCGGGNYCPSDAVLRSQMAVFLLRGEHGEAYAPPPATGIFADVTVPSFFADFIEQLYNEGITGGCATNPLRYCPGNSVLRSQMAIFLLRAEHGAAYVPPPATGIFADVPPGSFGADFIEQLYGEGITGGCAINPLRYCPNDPTNRGAMAVFLTRTFNLP